MDMVRLYSMADYESLPETSWHIKQPLEEDEREEALQSGTTGGVSLTATDRLTGRRTIVPCYLSLA